jgi:exosortase
MAPAFGLPHMSASYVAVTARPGREALRRSLPVIALTAFAFAALFGGPFLSLLREWWTNPEAGHGLLLGPLSAWLAWRRRTTDRIPMVGAGLCILVWAVAIRVVGGMAAEQYTIRLSMVAAAAGLTVFFLGARQLRAWWLPFSLLVLSIPLPDLILSSLALPLQFKASELGAWLLRARHVPVALTGNVIRIPGHDLFVTEACSGLRSLTALLSLAVLLGGMSLEYATSRWLLIAIAVPIAIVVNGARVFVTGFTVHFVGAEAGTGVFHATEGWAMFVVAFLALSLMTALGAYVERAFQQRSASE